ncbi:HD family hydrolase [Microvirga sp. W0021]|uniref:HD family hydrolase n=1 Tax=Hohaiivirga grylli TaxID=3133970 RepID=A0ABV0BH23_9HYPH
MSKIFDNQQRVWQRMLSGRRLDLINPAPIDVELEDIAHGLSRVARWNGQTTGEHIYSVAQHSLLVERIISILNPDLDKSIQLAALIHDAPEYVIGDMISPFKAIIGGTYKEVEARLMSAIHVYFKLPASAPKSVSRLVKEADQHAAYFEASHLAGFSEEEALELFGKPKIGTKQISDLLHPKPIAEVQAAFLKRAAELM